MQLRCQTVLRDFHKPSLSAALRDFSSLKTFCPAHNTVAGLALLCYDTEWPRTVAQYTQRAASAPMKFVDQKGRYEDETEI